MVTLFPGLPGATCVIALFSCQQNIKIGTRLFLSSQKPLKRRKTLYIRGFGFITVSSSCIFIFILCFQVVAHPTIYE